MAVDIDRKTRWYESTGINEADYIDTNDNITKNSPMHNPTWNKCLWFADKNRK